MPIDRLSVVLEANDLSLSSSIRRAGSTVDEFGRRLDVTGRTAARTTNDMTGSFSKLENVLSRGVTRSMVGFTAAAFGGYQAGRALNAALQDVVGGAIQFQAKMLNVNSISHLSTQQLGVLSKQVLDLSRTLPTSANDLASGLYDIASSGFQGAAGVKVLTASARAATAGLTDTATSARAIVGVLNAYGDGADQAKRVSDSLFQTVNVGVLSFADLAQGIGQVVGTAAAAHVPINDVGAAIATMTRAGLPAAESFTSLNQLLSQIIQPSDALQKVFGKLGYTSGAAALQSKGLAGVMADIQRQTGGNITAMSSLFSDIRALRGGLLLLSNSGQLYADSQKAMADASKGAGATQATLSVQLHSVALQWDILKNRAEAAAITFGTTLLPELTAGIHGVEILGTVLANSGVKHLVEFAAAMVAANLALRAMKAIAGADLVTTLARLAGVHTANAAAITAEGAAAARTAGLFGGLAGAEGAAGAAGGFAAIGAAGAAGIPLLAAAAVNAAAMLGRLSIVGLGFANLLSNWHSFGFPMGFNNDVGTGDVHKGQNIRLPDGTSAKVTGSDTVYFDKQGNAFSDPDLKHPVTRTPTVSHGKTPAADPVHSLIDQVTRDQAAQAKIDQTNQARQAAAGAFLGAFNIIGQFDPSKGAKAVSAAQDKLLTASRALREEEARYEAQKKHSVASEQQLAHAREAVATATRNLTAAQHAAGASGSLSKIYEADIRQGKQFVKDIRTDLRRGLDPAEVQRLLTEGPDKAGGLAHALASDKSGKLIKLSNENERQLAQLAVQAANLMQRALDKHPVSFTFTAGILPGSRGGHNVADNGAVVRPPSSRPQVVVHVHTTVPQTVKHETNVNVAGNIDTKAIDEMRRRQRRGRAVL